MRSCAYTRPKDSIHHKFKPDVPQNPLSNYAFQQIARIPNRIKKWSPNGSKKWSRIPLSSSLYYMSYIYLGPLFGCKGVSANARISIGSKRWSRSRGFGTRVRHVTYLLRPPFFAVKALGTGQVTAAQEAAHKLRTRGESKPYRHQIADLEKASRVHPPSFLNQLYFPRLPRTAPRPPKFNIRNLSRACRLAFVTMTTDHESNLSPCTCTRGITKEHDWCT